MESNFVEITHSENYQLNRVEIFDKTKLKSDFVAYHHTSLVAVNGTSPFNIVIPREDVFADPRDSHLDLEVQVNKSADDTLYADNDGIQPNNLFGFSLFREMLLKSFGSKLLESVENVYLASLMYKLLSDNEEDMMKNYKKETTAGIDTTKRNRLLNDTPEKGTVFVRIYLKDVFGFIAHLDKANYGLGNTLTLKRANSGNGIYRTIADEAKGEIKDIVWYVRHDTPPSTISHS